MSRKTTPTEAPAWALALQRQVEALSARVVELERAMAGAAPAVAAPQPPPTATEPSRHEVSEEDMVYIAAAVAAYLGVRARIRQVRLVQSAAWAQVGRATIHASHRVH